MLLLRISAYVCVNTHISQNKYCTIFLCVIFFCAYCCRQLFNRLNPSSHKTNSIIQANSHKPRLGNRHKLVYRYEIVYLAYQFTKFRICNKRKRRSWEQRTRCVQHHTNRIQQQLNERRQPLKHTKITSPLNQIVRTGDKDPGKPEHAGVPEERNRHGIRREIHCVMYREILRIQIYSEHEIGCGRSKQLHSLNHIEWDGEWKTVRQDQIFEAV